MELRTYGKIMEKVCYKNIKKKRLPKLPLDKLTETIIAANTIIDPT